MGTEAENVSREELRRKKRKKERMQAIAILAGVIVAFLLVIAIVIGGIVHAVSTKKENERELVSQQTQTTEDVEEAEEEVAEEEAEEEVAEEAISEENVLSEETETTEDEQEPQEETEAVDNSQEQEQGEETVSQTEVTEDVQALVDNQMSQMTLEQKVAQLFFVTPEQLMGRETPIDVIGSEFNAKIIDYPVGGIVLREGNMKDEETVSSLTSNIKLMGSTNILIGVCEEGGPDSPFVKSEMTENVLSSQHEVGESQGEAGAYSLGISIGSELKQYGFNLTFGPLGDVATFGASMIANRSFGTDIEDTKNLTKNVIYGLKDQGVVSCVKYFPSYGDIAQPRGSAQLVSQRTKEDLKSEGEIYKNALESGAELLMISHVSLPKVRGDKRPASLSREVITDIVREEWGYDGVIITDFMDQPCIYQNYTYAEAAAGAVEAGADMLLSTKNFEKSYKGILDAVRSGSLTEERIDESVRRILTVKYRHAN